MLFPSTLVGLVAATLALPAATAQESATDDTSFLQNALSQAFLSSALYSSGLSSFAAADFIGDTYQDWVRRRVVQINQHAATHQSTLQALLAASSASSAIPTACTYSFSFDTPTAFLEAASRVEQLSTSAFLTALPSLSSATLQPASALMLNLARHSAWLDSAVLQGAAWSGAAEPLLPAAGAEWDAFWSWVGAEGWVTDCPAAKPDLPLTAFDALSATGADDLNAGDTVALSFTTSTSDADSFVLYHGGATTLLALSSGSITLPSELQGTAYGFLTSASTADAVAADNVLAGPVVLAVGLASSAVSSS